MAHPGGRPTDYTPELIDELEVYLKEAVPQNMKIPTVEGFALKMGFSKDTLYEWAKLYPEFSDALNKLKMTQREVLIETGVFGGKEINANVVMLLLKVNHDMIEKSAMDITSAGEKLASPTVIIDTHGPDKTDIV